MVSQKMKQLKLVARWWIKNETIEVSSEMVNQKNETIEVSSEMVNQKMKQLKLVARLWVKKWNNWS